MSSTGDAPLLTMTDVGKIYYTDSLETHALSGIQLVIRRGEYVSITGPSGCGKSTLLSLLGLLDQPTSGTYVIGGHRVGDLSVRERAGLRNREIGFVFQSFNLIGDLTVRQNVDLPLAYRRQTQRTRREMVLRALDQVGLTDRMNYLPAQLSGGQQQRVAIARALVGGPSILLADEPTGNLDSKSGADVMNLIQELNEHGTTICIVTHDARHAQMARRTLQLFDGRIVEETFTTPAERAVAGSVAS